MWKLKDEAEGSTKEKNAQKMKMMLEGLKRHIEDLHRIEVGINVNEDDDDAYDVVAISDFETEISMTMYNRNAHHKQAVEFIESVSTDRIVVDYNVDM
jgi:hypothetical protein